MTRLIVIGARKTGTSLALVRAALDRQLQVTVISGPNDLLQGVFPPEVEIVNLQTEADAVVAWLRDRHPDPDRRLRVTTANDVYARLAAQVAEQLGLPGPDAAAVARSVSKASQKALLAASGLPTAKFVDGTLSDLPALWDRVGALRFPVVVKPSEGSASHGVKRCADAGEARRHAEALADELKANRRTGLTDSVIVEEFLEGAEYCVEYFDGRYVGAMRKLKRRGEGFLERGYTSELDLDDTALRRLIDAGASAIELAGLSWGPVHLDCIVRDGVPYVIELNPRIAGSFICDIVRDGYGFDIVAALLDKLTGRGVDVPDIFAPRSYAHVEFLLASDPLPWDFSSPGELRNADLHITYGPQRLVHRERRAYIYVRRLFQPTAEKRLHEEAVA
ncbi:ATP-grasp domain-containing protein [Variovorax sp. NFACC27]|uniref:ATP-grasp domain-containing protein n=1 Tax=unclassified Variovorax TaxID=663243 RepID=UPI00089B2483|nr:ATP-grasp domain-containing protein [Variovorax sp. NFACC28]SEG97366.1 ATP-grasp domain-containing protein [Variovorax sp. NFACC29]SFD90249.1 ATP-grasp domain-containing protein [Variovorax sp. NFACC26]SFH06282.1 ATP-grasp domain-containing protein [Variovorax sp. NFACC27]